MKPGLLELRAPDGHFPRLEKLALLMVGDKPWGLLLSLISLLIAPFFFTSPRVESRGSL